MKKEPKLHYGAGLTWVRNNSRITVGRNWPVCGGHPEHKIMRMDPRDVTCKLCVEILRAAGKLI